MDLKKLADDIINGKRLKREDDLSFFINCDLDALLEGADKIREYFCGECTENVNLTCVPLLAFSPKNNFTVCMR